MQIKNDGLPELVAILKDLCVYTIFESKDFTLEGVVRRLFFELGEKKLN